MACTLRTATPGDLAAIIGLTVEAYAPHREILGAPPTPVTEDYAPRIARGDVRARSVIVDMPKKLD